MSAPALVAAALLGLVACDGDPADVGQSAEFRPTTILDAVLVGDRPAVEQFIARGADVNTTEADGTSLLMRAIHGRFPAIAKLLIDAGANVSATNRYGVNPLYLAARGTDAATTRELLAAGADAKTSLPEGETVLMTAAKAGDAEIVRLLLAGRSGIALAPPAPVADNVGRGAGGVVTSGYGAAPAIVAGPENRAEPNAKEGWYGQTALMWAAAEGHADIARLLIAAGANVDEHSRLIDAPESSYERLQGDFVYPKNPQGRLTPLHFAAREGALAVVPVLIEAGADMDAVDAERKTALLLATLNGRLEVTRALLEAGANPNVADSYGRTVLFAAAQLRAREAAPRPASQLAGELTALDVVALALVKGADPNAPLADKPPLDADRPADPNPILDKGATPLFVAAISGDLEVMRLLLDRGADVNAANQIGDTALHGATLRGSTEIIQSLVDHGADVNAKNSRGQTPLDLAVGVPTEGIPSNEAAATLLRRLSGRS